MKYSLWLVLSATALVWVLLLLDLGGGRRKPFPLQPTEPIATLGVVSARSPGSRPTASKTVSHEPAARAQTPAGGELGEGELSPEFKELEERYGTEARDGSWAQEQERRVGALFANRAIETNLVLLNCQRTICRLVLEGSQPDLFAQLLHIPKLQMETGLGTQSPYSLRGGQLSLYFRRDGADSSASQ